MKLPKIRRYFLPLFNFQRWKITPTSIKKSREDKWDIKLDGSQGYQYTISKENKKIVIKIFEVEDQFKSVPLSSPVGLAYAHRFQYNTGGQ
jgi:hypothetical protein